MLAARYVDRRRAGRRGPALAEGKVNDTDARLWHPAPVLRCPRLSPEDAEAMDGVAA